MVREIGKLLAVTASIGFNSRVNRSDPEIVEPADIISEGAALASLCDHLYELGRFAFDTEFVSEDNYQPEVCLIQVATEEEVTLIDPMAGLDMKPFWRLISDEQVEVIVHAGMEDLAISFQQTGLLPTLIFDVQIAAGLMGFDYPLSLLRLVRKALNVRLHKSQTLTDWRERPLQSEQLHYAAEDVAHLPGVYRVIHDKLESLGRLTWAQEEMLRFSSPSTYESRSTQRLTKLKGKGALKRRGLAIAAGLLEVRDELAAEYNRPPRSILKDHLLIEIAQHGWTRVDQIKRLRGLNLRADAMERLVEAVRHARAQPEETWPVMQAAIEESPEEVALTSLITAVLQDFAHRNEISYQLLAVKQDVRTLVRSYHKQQSPPKQHPLLRGWRTEALGGMIEDILTGRRSIRVNPADGSFDVTG